MLFYSQVVVYLFDCLSMCMSRQTEQQVCNGKVYNVDVIQNEKIERNIYIDSFLLIHIQTKV